MTRVVTYKQFSGIVLHGEEPVTTWPGMNTRNHLSRCVLLAAQLEAPKWGTVQTYDGCGISGGIIHHTATFPGKQDLGSLWPLLEAVEKQTGHALIDGIQITDGIPHFRATGVKLTGDNIRELFTGTKEGRTATPAPAVPVANATAIHLALRSDASKAAQVTAAKAWLLKMTGKLSLSGIVNTDIRLADLEAQDFSSTGAELALCVARAFVINNPAAARRCYSAADSPTAPDFAKKLYHAFATDGHWTNRFRHTADAATRLGLWPRADTDVLQNSMHP
jgi:hypothetical protein